MSSELEKTIRFLEEHCGDPEETIRSYQTNIIPFDTVDEVKERRLIAEGGMGLIFEGEQRLPRRVVAIKKCKRSTPEDKQQLFNEAMIVGSLEHPNIIPIHQILLRADGDPAVVMKRVQGISFKQFIRDGCNLLEALQIMIPVCNAVEYAHSCRIIHRDIKPSNIMIGHFGEVYLLDWGLARSLDDSRKEEQIVGSPSFMAPEMLYLDNLKVSERTDVYLLGATLHYAITLKARHKGKNLKSIVDRIRNSDRFEYSSDVPEELAFLLNRTCAKNPMDRPKSVREFREELEAIKQHWPALQLTQEAQQRAFEVAQIRKCEQVNNDRLQGCHKIFTLARQDYEYALRIWPENKTAHRGLEELLLDMIHIHLQHEEYAAAWLLCGNLQGEKTALVEQIRALKDKAEALDPEQQRLLRIGAAHDFRKAQEESAPFAALIALSALLMGLWSNYAYVIAAQSLSPVMLLSSAVALLIIAAILILYRRENLLKNKAARGMYVEVVGTICTVCLNRLVGIQYDLDVNAVMSVDCFIIAFATVSIWPIIWGGGILTLICFALGATSMLFPTYSLTCLSIITMFTPAYTWYAWRSGVRRRNNRSIEV